MKIILFSLVAAACCSFNASLFLSTTSAYSANTGNYADAGDLTKGLKLLQVHVWSRHGTRFPTKGNMDDQLALMEKLKSVAGSPLADFKMGYGRKDADLLSPTGKTDALEFGKRVKKSLPSDFAVATEKITVQLSNIERSIETGKFFLAGFLEGGSDAAESLLQDKNKVRTVANRSLDADEDPNKSCANFIQGVEKIKKAGGSKDLEAFQQQWMPSLTKRIMNATKTHLNQSQVMTLFDTCAFHLANNLKAVPVCQFFTKQDYLYYDAQGDLEKWAMYGYNASISSKMACSTLTGFVKAVNGGAANGGSVDGTIKLHFNHAEAIMPLHTALGLNKDDQELKGDMTLEQLTQRKWQTRTFSPFLGNVIIKVYGNAQGGGGKVVQTLVDENMVKIPACRGDWICGFDQFVRYYTKSGVIGCDYDKVCGNSGEKSVGGWSDDGKVDLDVDDHAKVLSIQE